MIFGPMSDQIRWDLVDLELLKFVAALSEPSIFHWISNLSVLAKQSHLEDHSLVRVKLLTVIWPWFFLRWVGGC